MMRLLDLLEGYEIRQGLKFTLPPTYVMTDLPNNDAYLQYRHLVALASARASFDANSEHLDHEMDDESPWGENQAVICYTKQDQETLELANKIMGVGRKPLTTTMSQEAPWRNTKSPVRKFVDLSESISTANEDDHEHGTISLLRPDEQTKEWVLEWCHQNGISCIDPDRMHCTVLYSQKPMPIFSRLHGRSMNVFARPKGLKVLGKALVIELDCHGARQIHEWMVSRGGTHDYPEYIPHLTVCYDWEHGKAPDAKLPSDQLMRFTSIEAEAIKPNYVEEIKGDQ